MKDALILLLFCAVGYFSAVSNARRVLLGKARSMLARYHGDPDIDAFLRNNPPR